MVKQFEVPCRQCRCQIPVNRRTTKLSVIPEPCTLCNGTGVFVFTDGEKRTESRCVGCDGLKTPSAWVTCPFPTCRARPIKMPLSLTVVNQLPFLHAPAPVRPPDVEQKLFPKKLRVKDYFK